jgi:arylsulfatase A-like enzyme
LKSGVTWSWSPPLIEKSRTTVASLLKDNGYATACVGKWHLGLGWQTDTAGVAQITRPLTEGPNDLGFDYFFGITASLDIPPYIYIENNQSTTQNVDTVPGVSGKKFWRKGLMGDDFTHIGVLPKLTEKAVEYINYESANDDPFFLYFPLPAPHTPILPTEEFQGKSGTNEYGDFVMMVDDVVGQVVAALEETNQLENTIVIFTSDNGCSPMANFEELQDAGHSPSYIYRGHKADIFDGGHRVPFIVYWPNKINAGGIEDNTICHTDLMSTVATIVGDTLAPNEGEDSYDFSSLLYENGSTFTREYTVHHSINGSYSIRNGKWKLSFCPGSGGWSSPQPKKARELELPGSQLYDMDLDPAEETNLIDEEPEIVKNLTMVMEEYITNGRSTPGTPQENDTETKLYIN